MPEKLLYSKDIGQKLKKRILEDVKSLKSKGIYPFLVAVDSVDNPGSALYLRQQEKDCQELGIKYERKCFKEGFSQDDVLSCISEFNDDDRVTGIILQRPVADNLHPELLQNTIMPDKDVEGIHPYNLGKLLFGDGLLIPPTVKAVLELIKATGIDLKGKGVVVVGHSKIVGKPLALALLSSAQAAPTVTVCHIATKDLSSYTKTADVLVVAVGKPGIIIPGMVKTGAIVVDVGINKVSYSDKDAKAKGQIVGDVDFEGVKDKVSFITPVPGGVGPLTSLMLMNNVIICAEKAYSKKN